jgi:hypothetical protein
MYACRSDIAGVVLAMDEAAGVTPLSDWREDNQE